jgi:rhamnose utilization protein RhaD (predicted bifunctional aldolase and dehydrogenase)
MPDNTLDQLVALSNRLGDPARDYVILGEGNTSARADAETLWVKASGAELRTAGSQHFVRVRIAPVLEMLEGGQLDDGAVKQGLAGAKVDAAGGAHPSVETLLHAVCLQIEGAVAPPPAVNSTCSNAFENTAPLSRTRSWCGWVSGRTWTGVPLARAPPPPTGVRPRTAGAPDHLQNLAWWRSGPARHRSGITPWR